MSDRTELVVLLGVARQALRDLHDLTGEVDAEYQPRGWDADTPRTRSSGVSRPIPVHLDQDGHPTGRALDGPLGASTVHLHAAVADLVDAGLGDLVAPTRVHADRAPDVAVHLDLLRRLAFGLDHLTGRLPLDDDLAAAAVDCCETILAALDVWPRWLTRDQRRCAGRPEWWSPADGVWELRPRDCQRRIVGRGARCEACKRWLSRLRSSPLAAG